MAETHKPKPITLNLTGLLICLYLNTISFQGEVLLFFILLFKQKKKLVLHLPYIILQNIQKFFGSSLWQLYIERLSIYNCTETSAKTSNEEKSLTHICKGQECDPDLRF